MESHNLDEPNNRDNAVAVAAALNGGSFWTELPWWRRLGLVVLWAGVAAFSMVLLIETANRWLWIAISLSCVVVGAALFLGGARISTTETWPPD